MWAWYIMNDCTVKYYHTKIYDTQDIYKYMVMKVIARVNKNNVVSVLRS
jgi:hypothetical protein